MFLNITHYTKFPEHFEHLADLENFYFLCDFASLVFFRLSNAAGPHFTRFVHCVQISATVLHLQFARFLSENADLLQENFRHLDLTVGFLECQIQNLFATVYSILSRQFPGQVLSSLLRRPVAAITTGDILQEIICRPINATSLHSLQFGRHFSSRPVVHYVNSQGNLTLGQIYLDGNIYPGVQFIEKYIPDGVFTLRVANHLYTFQHYSRSNVYRLSPDLAPVDVHFDASNSEQISSLFLTSELGFEDITSILRTIIDANLIYERLNSLLLDRPTTEASANPDYRSYSFVSFEKHFHATYFVYNQSHS